MEQAYTPVVGAKADEAALIAAGYTKQHHPESWRDIGGPESGPKLIGGPAYDEWTKGANHIYVEDGVVAAVEDYDNRPNNFPF